MNSIDPLRTKGTPVEPETDAGVHNPEAAPRARGGMMSGMGRYAGFGMVMAVVLIAAVIAGLTFGWSGWLTASLGGISIIILLPCLLMCGGVIWMMFSGSGDGSSKDRYDDRRP